MAWFRHGATPVQAESRGFLPVDYVDPDNVACINLLYTPPEPERLGTAPLDPHLWERRFDGGEPD